MRYVPVTLVFWGALVTTAAAQYGTAPSNYYPDAYNGSTFTGVVTGTKDDQITLTYTKGAKTTTFVGRFEKPCSVPRIDKDKRGMAPSDIPPGTVMTAYFEAVKKKVDQEKIKENLIIAISFDVWQGKKMSEDTKKIYLCTGDTHVQFMAW
jgi:hypothetical protein